MNQQAKVLCVDDEPQILSALARSLFEENYQLLTAESGAAGLEILAAEPDIRVIVADFRMPSMNGVEFLKLAREGWPDTVRIVLSGYADTAAVVSAINEGQIYKFIPKPWHEDELKITIAKALEIHALRVKNRSLAQEIARTRTDLATGTASRARKVLDLLPLGILISDDQGVILDFNRPMAAYLAQGGDAWADKRIGDPLPVDLFEYLVELRSGGTDALAAGGASITGRPLISPGAAREWLFLFQPAERGER